MSNTYTVTLVMDVDVEDAGSPLEAAQHVAVMLATADEHGCSPYAYRAIYDVTSPDGTETAVDLEGVEALAEGDDEDEPEPKHDHDARPDDLPEPGDRCKDCGEDITWMGPGMYDWVHTDDQERY